MNEYYFLMGTSILIAGVALFWAFLFIFFGNYEPIPKTKLHVRNLNIIRRIERMENTMEMEKVEVQEQPTPVVIEYTPVEKVIEVEEVVVEAPRKPMFQFEGMFTPINCFSNTRRNFLDFTSEELDLLP